MSNELLVENKDGLLVLTMNRPERRNALSPALLENMVSTLAAAADDPNVRAVMLTGAGGHFCAGGDVKAMNEGAGQDLPYGNRHYSLRDRMNASRLLHQMPKPTIAAIDGAVAGAGLSMALACDFRVCSTSSKITTAFAKVGLSGDFGGSYFLTSIVGSAKARELYFLSPVLTGEEALAIGLVNRAVEPDQVQGVARELAEQLANGPTFTLARIKQNINLAVSGANLADCFDQEAKHHMQCTLTEDHKEAAAAFVEKRAPVFKGK
ncbi:enoyl-CoA hydratase [Aurantivibrio plasticivorans]